LVAFTTTRVPVDDLQALAALRARFSSVTLVIVATDRDQKPPLGIEVVRITAERPFAVAWRHHLSSQPAMQ
jgi:hypothetical protein